ncbi:stalk domain-containing protein [Paenibacillus sp. NPDC056579]|uniref:stalk domain-containing protein n=1 Tax=Paenibacillus sp. NPDC056579 TaxID=3345871 RepID=UPI0036A28327
MRKRSFLLSTVLLSSLLSPFDTMAAANLYLPEEEGFEVDWTFTETPPKRPQPKILNPAHYESKWKIDDIHNSVLLQDRQGVLYTTGMRGIVQALYPNGQEKWSIPLDTAIELPVTTPVLGQDGTLYVNCTDIISEDGRATIFALTPEGKIKWKLDSTDTYSRFDTQFAGDEQGNYIYFTKDGLTSRNAKGELNWINKTITSSQSVLAKNSHMVSVSVDSTGNIYVDSARGEVISIDSTGVERWRTKSLPYVNKYTGFHPYLSEKGFLYVLTEHGLNALDTRNGSTLDSNSLDLKDIQSAGVPTDGHGGYYINIRGKFFKIDRTGETIWEYKLRDTAKEGIYLRDILTDKEGNAYFSTGVGNIIALNSDGQEIFVFLRNAFWTKFVNLTLGKNGNIYSINNDIGVVAFGKKQIQVYVDNLSLPLAVDPINHEGTVLVPFRSLFEKFGLKVEWDPTTQTITGSKDDLLIKLTIGETTAFVNGQAQQLAEAPMIQESTTFVPLRFVGETLGKKVTWDGDTSTINIDQ